MRPGLAGRGLVVADNAVVGVRYRNVGSVDGLSALALEPVHVDETLGPLFVSASVEMKGSNLIVPHSTEHSKLKLKDPDEARSSYSCACARVLAPARALVVVEAVVGYKGDQKYTDDSNLPNLVVNSDSRSNQQQQQIVDLCHRPLAHARSHSCDYYAKHGTEVVEESHEDTNENKMTIGTHNSMKN